MCHVSTVYNDCLENKLVDGRVEYYKVNGQRYSPINSLNPPPVYINNNNIYFIIANIRYILYIEVTWGSFIL